MFIVEKPKRLLMLDLSNTPVRARSLKATRPKYEIKVDLNGEAD